MWCLVVYDITSLKFTLLWISSLLIRECLTITIISAAYWPKSHLIYVSPGETIPLTKKQTKAQQKLAAQQQQQQQQQNADIPPALFQDLNSQLFPPINNTNNSSAAGSVSTARSSSTYNASQATTLTQNALKVTQAQYNNNNSTAAQNTTNFDNTTNTFSPNSDLLRFDSLELLQTPDNLVRLDSISSINSFALFDPAVPMSYTDTANNNTHTSSSGVHNNNNYLVTTNSNDSSLTAATNYPSNLAYSLYNQAGLNASSASGGLGNQYTGSGDLSLYNNASSSSSGECKCFCHTCVLNYVF